MFEDVELDIAQGEMCILLGPSGCGKTTLLRAVAGLVRPDRGRLVIGGEDVTSRPPQARGIAMTFQHYALFPNMTVRQNLAFGLQQQRRSRAQVAAKVDAALALMELIPRADARPAQLSGGQKNGSLWPVRWCWSLGCCCWTSRSPRSMRKSASGCATS